jgi:methylthioribose-1-phosphate isomerase
MKIDGQPYRSIWPVENNSAVEIIDQRKLPHHFVTVRLEHVEDAAAAIRDMYVRGAPLIGATAAYGVCLALKTDASDASLERAVALLQSTRPTAINLRWALSQMREAMLELPESQRPKAAFMHAAQICDEDVELCRAMGRHGLALIETLWKQYDRSINILTHCNAGWLATVDWGTALAPIYMAHDAGIPVHVWVDETRPRNQGAHLTAWELGQHGVPHSLIVDNAGGHLMQHGQVDICFVGTDRTTASGDVCNKIGTYLNALAAKDNEEPFYVCAPSPSIDWTINDGHKEIPIEQRSGAEVHTLSGLDEQGNISEIKITPDTTSVSNFAFDVTPARLVTGLVTERGVCDASRAGLRGLFPEKYADLDVI